ncbi:MAG: peptide chain release factor N(5)-glutamine methyltransferase [Pacificimonas sp.]
MRVADAVRAAAEALREGRQPETARLDAELLAAHLLHIDRSALLLSPDGKIDRAAYDALIARRRAGEPLAYIVGKAEFWSLTFAVTPDVLIPRADSEVLIETALRRTSRPPAEVLDLGTGSGCLLLATLTEFPDAAGLGIDQSDSALSIARRNAAALGLKDRADFRRGNWTDGLTDRFDLILCNPPYVDEVRELGPGVREYEPGAALFADEAGLADYRELMPRIAAHLTLDGLALVELGAGQTADVRAFVEASGLVVDAVERDLAGHERALTLRPA